MKYFNPDPNSGGTPIVKGAVPPSDPAPLTNRRIARGLGYPQTGSEEFAEIGTAGGADWLRMGDTEYAHALPHLTAAEIASAVATAPAGYKASASRAQMGPHVGKTDMVWIGDSKSWFGKSTGSSGTDSYPKLAAEIAWGAMPPAAGGVAFRDFSNGGHGFLHYGMSGYRIGTVGDANWATAHAAMSAQKYQTLPLKQGDIIGIELGTNDTGAAATGAAMWARLTGLLTPLMAAHPSAKFIVGTETRDGEGAANPILNDFNVLIRANAASFGYTVFDLEAAHADFSTTTGNSASALYLDGRHFSDGGKDVIAAALAVTLNQI